MSSNTFDLNDIAAAVLQGAGDAVVACDAEGIIGFWNPGAVRIFGFTAQEAVGRSLDIVIPERLRARHWHGYRRVMESGESRYGAGETLSVPSQHKDGRRLSIEFTIAPMRDAQGRISGLAAVMRDVTPRFEEIKMLRRQLSEKTAG